MSLPSRSALAIAIACCSQAALAEQAPVQLDNVVVSAAGFEQKVTDAPASISVIGQEDLRKKRYANLAQALEDVEGVDVRQGTGKTGGLNISIRGLPSEYTLILIDGRRQNTAGNVTPNGFNETSTSFMPPMSAIERIEVIRGPMSTLYGSDAMGGVVNIITKRPTDKLSGSITAYTSLPEDDAEGMSKRTNFSLSGPLGEAFSFRLYGGASTTDADDADINAAHQASEDALVSGREGVRNKDINALLSWQLNPEQSLDLEAGYSRQGNIYAGDTMNNNGGGNPEFINSLYGHETNVMQRSNYALTHKGDFDWGSSKASLSYDYTRNWRLNEGLAGGPEGAPSEGAGAFMSRLRNTRANAEVNLPLSAGLEQVLTLGSEYLYESLNDPGSLREQSFDPDSGDIPGFSRDQTKTTAHSYALFAEDNIQLGDRTIVTPGLRFDDHEEYGGNWSPSLNASHELTDELTLKGGIARAYKTPNLYQSNPGYLLYSRGNGCNASESNSGGCYLVGNPDLEPETSINKEIGLAFDKGSWRTSATYFRNDYRNKIVGSNQYITRLSNGRRVLQWENTDEAVVEGVEGNLFVALSPQLEWNTNFTYMLESEDKQTGEPLSVIPEYTLNSSLDWQVTQQLSLQLTGTYYGKQEAPSLNRRTGQAIDADAQQDLDPYGLVGVSAGYEFNSNYSLRVGISNLLDKQIYREGNANDAGANTYNEPGRAYFASVTASF